MRKNIKSVKLAGRMSDVRDLLVDCVEVFGEEARVADVMKAISVKPTRTIVSAGYQCFISVR